MKCGVRFCGGCNPRFERGDVLNKIKEHFGNRVEFFHAQEGELYDLLLVIGGCTNCCAEYCQFDVKGECIRMWDDGQFGDVVEKIEREVDLFELEG